MYSDKIFKLCELRADYLYHFCYNDGEYDRLYNCFSKEQVQELYEKVKQNKDKFRNLTVYKVDVKYIDFSEPNNFIKLLKIFNKHYTLYDNWFKGNDTFENNFLCNLTRKLELDWQFNKVKNIIKDIQKDKWSHNKICSYCNMNKFSYGEYIKKY